MTLSRRRFVINSLLLLALACWGTVAGAAQVAGTVMNLSGPLLAKKADGTARILAVKSEVEQGDTLVTQKNTYASVKFIDNSEITLRPDSSMTIDSFAFDAGKPDADSAAFSLLKGGLRSITGLLGKRNKERFSMKTPSATIGIRGTTFIVEFVPQPEAAPAAGQASKPASPASARAPGLYVHVIDGLINLSNGGGSQQFSAGQFGFTPNFVQPPVLLPVNPGIRFTPPPAFSSSSPAGTNGPGAAKPAAVDCIVR